jgi:hypothetical protein
LGRPCIAASPRHPRLKHRVKFVWTSSWGPRHTRLQITYYAQKQNKTTEKNLKRKKKKKSIPFCFSQNVLTDPLSKKKKKHTHIAKKKKKKSSDQLVSICQSLIIVPDTAICLCPVRLRVQACAKGPAGVPVPVSLAWDCVLVWSRAYLLVHVHWL